jgi:hypothetical protein
MSCWRNGVSAGDLGDPGLSSEGREILRRFGSGDLVGELRATLDAMGDADPLPGGIGTDTDD